MFGVSLTEDWRMASGREVLGGCFYDPEYDVAGWMPVAVPTTAQAALVEQGRAPSPWRDRQAQALETFENDTWYFRNEFTVPNDGTKADRFELVLEGVSLFATVWLNGAPVGFLRNAHHPHRLDVTAHIQRKGRNVLVLECRLDLETMKKQVRSDVSKDAQEIRPYMRLCQMSFGWDFAPRLLVHGPWRPVGLECHSAVSIDDLHVRTESIGEGAALLTVEAMVRAHRALDAAPTLHLSIHETPESPAVWETSVAVTGGASIALPVTLKAPRLWSPRPMGEPHLYHVRARLECGGVTVDTRRQRFGIRTVELKQDDQFTLCINGTDVFAKGANWVPADSLRLDAAPEHYRHLLELARDAHFNMLRVWGGGIYEPELFYDLCDELGIMVWQDFMYACAMYPDDDTAFMESAAQEAREAVTRLRRHPSLVLWCGNNECQEAWVLGDWPARAPRHLGERLYDHVLPDTVRALQPDVPYWPGSPYGGPTTRSRDVGDFHDWYSLPNWRSYDENAPRFSSEYGMRSLPQRETVDAMLSPEVQWERNGPQNNVWYFHHGACGWMNNLLAEFGKPETLDDYIMFTQEGQATLMRYAVEVYRRRMFATSGSLIWQYNEPWPAATFSLVDYYGRPKAAYYWVRGAYAPVIGLFYRKGENISYWGVNEFLEEKQCRVRLRRFSYAGELLGETALTAALAPNASSLLLGTLPAELRLTTPESEFLHAELVSNQERSTAVYHGADRKNWPLAKAVLEVSATRLAPDRLRLTLTADRYVHFASATVADPVARFSDNYVDVIPGEAQIIEIRTRDKGPITLRSANAPTQRIGITE